MIEPPLSIYLHLPWCIRKCPYCDFNSHSLANELPQRDYVNALKRDLEHESKAISGRPIQSIFFGGGTPSLFSVDAITELLDAINRCFVLSEDVEITLEANPGAADKARFEGYYRAGINRLSIGVQSITDSTLGAIGRIHSASQARQSLAAAVDAGFENLNIDLMYGLPQQQLNQAISDLEQALQFEPAHISVYQLTIEPHTKFYKSPPSLPCGDEIEHMQQCLQRRLSTAGYRQYEVSAYARHGKQCRHNLNYWLFGDYIGLGAGAHGKLTSEKIVQRYCKTKHPGRYMSTAGKPKAIGAQQLLDDEDLMFEFLMNALRLTAGFDLALMSARTGLPAELISQRLRPAVERGWLEADSRRVVCSPLGYRFLDTLLMSLLPVKSERHSV